MAKRIKIVGNALRVEDTVSAKIHLDKPSKDMWYNTEYLDNGIVLLVEKDGSDGSYNSVYTCDLADAVNESDVSFTAETLRTFISSNLGFSIAGSSALKTNDYNSRVLSDGGVIESLSCVKRALKDTIRNEPSLLLVPSGYKESVLYSVLPENGTGDGTFSRLSTKRRVNSEGVIETIGVNVPPLDYTDGGCPVLNLENEATNLITYSEDFNQWDTFISGSGLSPLLTPNASISPDGQINTYTVKLDLNGGATVSDRAMIRSNAVSYTEIDYTASIYLKASKTSEIGKTVRILYEAIGFTETIHTLTDEWVRVENKVIPSTSGLSRFIIENRGEYTNSPDVEFLIWGAQLEQGTTATSYIPTEGSTVTRIADVATLPIPVGVTEIIETINGVEQTPITVFGATHEISKGKINKVLMK